MADTDPEYDPHHLTRRDSETMWALGTFLLVLAVLVLAGTFFADRFHAMVINFIAGVVLLVIALGMIWRGRVIKRNIP